MSDPKQVKKPPLGVEPKYIADYQRFIDISKAISRYWDAGLKIPLEWVEEYNELVEKVRWGDKGNE